MKKKLLSLLCAAAILLSLIPATVFAATPDFALTMSAAATKGTSTEARELSELQPGDIVTVDVTVPANIALIGAELHLSFDKDAFELTAAPTTGYSPKYDEAAATAGWNTAYNTPTSTANSLGEYATANTASKYVDGAAVPTNTTNSSAWKIISASFKVKEAAPAGAHSFKISKVVLSYDNTAGKTTSYTVDSSATVSATVAQELSSIALTATVTTPSVGGKDASSVTAGTGYTGTVTWEPELTDGKFAADTAYKATVTLTPATDYTFADAMTVTGLDGFTFSKQADGTYAASKTFDKTAAAATDTDDSDDKDTEAGAVVVAVPDTQTFTDGGDTAITATTDDGNTTYASVTFSPANIDALKTSDGSTVTVDTDAAKVTLDKDVLAYLQTAAKKDTFDTATTAADKYYGVILRVQNLGTDLSGLTSAQKSTAMGNSVYELSLLLADGTAIFSKDDTTKAGKITVSIPYTPVVANAAPSVYYLATDGTTEDMDTTYADGALTFKTEHFSGFMLDVYENTEYDLKLKATDPGDSSVIFESDGTPNYNVGDTFTVDVYANAPEATDATANVQAIQFQLDYNRKYLKATKVEWNLLNADGTDAGGTKTFDSDTGLLTWSWLPETGKDDVTPYAVNIAKAEDTTKIATVTFKVLKDFIEDGTSVTDESAQIGILTADPKIVTLGKGDNKKVCTVSDNLQTRLHNLTVDFKNGGSDMKEATTYVNYGKTGYYTDEDRTTAYTVPTPVATIEYNLDTPLWKDAEDNKYADNAAVEALTFKASDTLTVRVRATDAVSDDTIPITHKGIDGVKDEAEKGKDFSFTPTVDDKIITDVHVAIDGADYTGFTDTGDGSYMIPKAALADASKVEITVDTVEGKLMFIYNDDKDTSTASYEDYLLTTGYCALPAAVTSASGTTTAYKIAILKGTPRVGGQNYAFGTTKCVWSDKYNAYVAIVSDSMTTAQLAKTLKTVSESPDEVKYGDASGNGVIDTADASDIATMMTQYMSGMNALQRFAADYNGDYVVNVDDIDAVLLYYRNSKK